MKKLNFLSKVCGLSRASQYCDVGIDRRLTVGSPSGLHRLTKYIAVMFLLLVVGVGNAWGVNVDSGNTPSFTSTSGDLDTYISYAAAQAGGTNAPIVSNSKIRIYRYNKTTAGLGGTLTVTASGGAKITAITFTISSSLGYSVSVDGGAATTGTGTSIAKSSINATSVTLQNNSTSQMDVSRIQVTYTAPTPCTITWHVNSGTTTAGSPTTSSTTGSKVTALPIAPTSAACDGSKVFVGWTETAIDGTTNTKPADLFTTAAGAPTLTQTTTHYYAVFATASTVAATATFGWESADDATKWTLSNLSTKATYNTYKNSGSYAGSNGSSATASIKFNNQISPTAISCKYTKATTNTNSSSKFIIQTSTDGSSWTDKATGKTMNNVTLGTFETLSWSGTLSDVYVRVYYTGTNAARVLDDVSITYSSTTYSNYATTCCTELGSINGSVTWSNGNAKLIWDKDSHASGYTVKWKTTAGGADTYSTTYVTTIKDTLTNKKTCSVTNLTGGSSYNFKIIATGQTTPSLYCDKEEILTSTAPKINASGTLTGSDYETSSGPGKVKTFDVSGVGLIAGSLTFAVPTSPAQYFEISTDNGSSWGSSKTLAVSAGTLAATTIKVRLKAGLSSGTYGPHTITISGGGAANNTSVTIAGTAISVTVQKKDETGATISDAGVTATASGTTLTASAGSTNYVFHTWKYGTASGTSIADASSATTSLTGTPTGDVIVIAEFYKPRTIVWKVNNAAYTPGTPGTATAKHNTAWSALTLPTDPDVSNYCGQKFVGWTTTDMGESSYDKDDDADAIEDLDLMTSENQSTKTEQKIIDATTTFHAVFADYDE